MSAFRTAFVYVRNTYAGALKETDAGYTFCYDDGYLKSEKPSAVSLTLPLQEEAYVSKTLFSFFDGLIPEGWLLDVVSRMSIPGHFEPAFRPSVPTFRF